MILFFQGSIMAQEEVSQTPKNPYEFFHGFYIGEGLGVAFNIANVDLRKNAFRDAEASRADGNLDHFSTMDLYQNRMYGEIYGGWGYQFCMGLHIGARAGVNFSSFDIIHKEKTITSSPSSDVQVGFINQEIEIKSKIHSVDYTVDAKIGWAFGLDTMVYFLIGGAFNKPEAVLYADSTIEYFLNGVTQIKQQLDEKNRSKKYRLNLHMGVGVEQKILEFLGLNVLYSFTNYSERSTSVSGQAEASAFNTTIVGYSAKLKSHMKRHAFTIGLAYHF